MVKGTLLEVDDLVRKIAIPRQSFDCSSSRNHADLNSTGLQGNTVERKTEEPGQVSLFRNNATRILTFYCYKPTEQIDTALRTFRKFIKICIKSNAVERKIFLRTDKSQCGISEQIVNHC